MALRGEVHEFSGNISVSPFAIGPDGKQVNIADLETMPLYPSVEERLAWSDRSMQAGMYQDDDTLFYFCDHKEELLAAKMSEAEEVQFWLAWEKPRTVTELALPTQFSDASGRAWTLEELKGQPLPPIVRTLKKWDVLLEEMGERFESSETAAVRACFVLEGYAMYQQMERLLPQLSDAQLLQLCLS